MAEIWGVVLAAGTSSRLGRPKQLVDVAGEPALNHVLRATAMSSLAGTVLVLGHGADDIAGQVGDFGQVPVLNGEYAAGQSTSLRAGIAALPSSADSAMVLLGDQPIVTGALVDAVARGWADGSDPLRIVQAHYGTTLAPPVLFGRHWFEALSGLEGDAGARELVRSNRDHVTAVDAAEVPLLDLDTEVDIARLRAYLASR